MNNVTVTKIKTFNDFNIKNKNVAAYVRVSTKKQLQESSFEVQVAAYYKMITENPSWNFSGVFADFGKSGTSINKRIEFNKMIELARLGEIDMIFTKSVSRFTRDIVDGLKTIQELRALNVEIFFEKENISSIDPVFDMFLTIYTSVAEEESKQISSNVNWIYTKKVKEGLVTTPKLYGYIIKDGKFYINPEEAPAVRLIYEMYLNGYKYKDIVHEVHASGFRKFSPTAIREILRNEKYVGDMELRKTTVTDIGSRASKPNTTKDKAYVTNNHEGIVDRDTFNKVQKVINDRKIKYAPINPKVRENKYANYIFSPITDKYYKTKVNHRNTKYEVMLLEMLKHDYNRAIDVKNIYYRQIDEVLDIAYDTLKKNKSNLKELIFNELDTKTKALNLDSKLESYTTSINELKAKRAQVKAQGLSNNLTSDLNNKITKDIKDLKIKQANIRFNKILKYDYSKNYSLFRAHLRKLETSDDINLKDLFKVVIAKDRDDLLLCIKLSNRNFNDIDLKNEVKNTPIFKGTFKFIQTRLKVDVNWSIIII